MFIVYDLIFLVVAIIYLPIYLFRRKFHRGFLSRLGILPQGLELNHPIWVHAVSVGEAMAVKGLVEKLRKIFPAKKFVISTVTPTGNRIAKGIAKDGDYVTYLPLDFSFITRSVIEKIKPSLFIIAETEIWPNLISTLYENKVPTVIVNGRISNSSFRGYLGIKLILKPILNKVVLFCMQTNRDAERLICLGARKEKIHVVGNMKFDIATAEGAEKKSADYKIKLGLNPEDKLLVAGSTHPQEEEIILSVYKNLLHKFSNLRLLIAPRHPERAKKIGNLALKNGLQPVLISNLRLTTYDLRLTTIFILDTIGQLASLYSIADIVFVGGSLVKKGGHNILEPAILAKPILFGPYMFNFKDIIGLFLENKAAVLVRDQEELEERAGYLLTNFSWANELGQRAKQLVFANQGATQKVIEYINRSDIIKHYVGN